MDALKTLFVSGHVIDIIVILMWCEAIALIVYHRASGKGLRVWDVLPNVASGFFLMLGIRFALVHASWMYIGAVLLASLIVHAVDTFRRWPR